MSLSQKFSYAKRKVWAMLKKKKNIHAKKHEKKKKSVPKSMNNPMLRSMKKSKRKKDNPYFQIKGNHLKERESHDQRSTKIFRITKDFKIPHTCTFLIKVYDLHLLGSSF